MSAVKALRTRPRVYAKEAPASTTSRRAPTGGHGSDPYWQVRPVPYPWRVTDPATKTFVAPPRPRPAARYACPIRRDNDGRQVGNLSSLKALLGCILNGGKQFVKPVLALDGFTYEHAALQRYFKFWGSDAVSPHTGKRFTSYVPSGYTFLRYDFCVSDYDMEFLVNKARHQRFGYSREQPDWFSVRCLLSNQTLVDPVVLVDAHRYKKRQEVVHGASVERDYVKYRLHADLKCDNFRLDVLLQRRDGSATPSRLHGFALVLPHRLLARISQGYRLSDRGAMDDDSVDTSVAPERQRCWLQTVTTTRPAFYAYVDYWACNVGHVYRKASYFGVTMAVVAAVSALANFCFGQPLAESATEAASGVGAVMLALLCMLILDCAAEKRAICARFAAIEEQCQVPAPERPVVAAPAQANLVKGPGLRSLRRFVPLREIEIVR